MASLLTVLMAGLCAPWAAADTGFETPPDVNLPTAHDTGWAANRTGTEAVVLAFPVVHDGAHSLRLYFERVLLSGDPRDGSGSVLRITSMADGAVQVMDATAVAQWNHSSAYFNGDAVFVEVVSAPGTGPNRVVLASVDVGVPAAPAADFICGTDDRLPSTDARVARLMPSACTSWIIEDCGHCFLTAGHCVGGINAVEFNVPFSSSSGSLVHPGPEDQYPVDVASLQSSNNGPGSDWAHFGCFANSNTGLTPFEAQGNAFVLGAAPDDLEGQTLRVTGHGTDCTPDCTYNQVQQSSTGPIVTAGSAIVTFQVDVIGGNSGSPAYWEEGGVAIGIVTHCGCTSGGGANTATAAQQVALTNALCHPLGVCATGPLCALFTDLGNALSSPTFAAPKLKASGTLQPGTPVTITLSTPFNAAGMTATMFVGLSLLNAPFKGGTLVPTPDLTIVGLPLDNSAPPGARLEISALWPAGVPSGTSVIIQDWVDVPWIFGSELIASNGLSLNAP